MNRLHATLALGLNSYDRSAAYCDVVPRTTADPVDEVRAFIAAQLPLEPQQARGLKLFEHDRSVAVAVLAPFFDGYFGPPRPAGEALRDAETFCALFADDARWFSPFRYEVGEGRRSQFGPAVVLGNSVEGGFFAVDDDRVGGVYVGDED